MTTNQNANPAVVDSHVEAVIAKHRQRAEVGLRKYGVTTERGDLSTAEWLQHLQEELLDAAVYVEAAMNGKPQPPPPSSNQIAESGLAASITDADLESIATDREPMSGLASGGKDDPWAWAVVDPNNRLRNQEGDKVDHLVCWCQQQAHDVCVNAIDKCEEGDPEPYIVPLIPATSHAELVEQLAEAESAIEYLQKKNRSLDDRFMRIVHMAAEKTVLLKQANESLTTAQAQLAEAERKLRQSHHLCCNYRERVLGECNCVAVMKKELSELTTAQAQLAERDETIARLQRELGERVPNKSENEQGGFRDEAQWQGGG